MLNQETSFAEYQIILSNQESMINLAFLVVCITLLLGVDSKELSSAEPLSYNQVIRPILSENCFACHGPDEAAREGGVRLDREDSATQKADSGEFIIVPGRPEKSELMRRVESQESDERMPPGDSGHQLLPQQVEQLRQWITEGAAYEKHWSFARLEDTEADVGMIDRLVRAKLEAIGLRPAGPAEPTTQLRRVSIDLTGLPPSILEVDHYLRRVDEVGLDTAYEEVVDRLLASPRYGERMTWQWLEAARYADTDGYQNDGPREMWRWRDWVISAYNENMSFDQFTIEQLAGDLLPSPTESQVIATAFNRNNRYNSEEGIPIDEFLLENAVDRVDTTSTVWMGITMGCARCHDHKFDPFTQVEYYQLIDYFNDVAESGRAVKFGNSEPWIHSPTKSQRAELSVLEQRRREAEEQLRKNDANIELAMVPWEQQGGSKDAGEPPIQDGLDHYYSFDAEDESVKWNGDGVGEVVGVSKNAIQISKQSHVELPKIPGLIGNGRFSVSFWMKPESVDAGPLLSNEEGGTGRAGILVEFVEGHLRWNNNTRWISGVSTIETERKFGPGEWIHVALTNDGTQRAAGMRIYIDGQLQKVNIVRNTNSNTAPRNTGTPMRLGYSKHLGYWAGELDEMRFYTQRTLDKREVKLLAIRRSIQEIQAEPLNLRSDLERALSRIVFLEQGAGEPHRKLLDNLRAAQKKLVAYRDALPTTMVMQDLPEGRPSYVRNRGVYDSIGEAVSAGVPSVLPDLYTGRKSNRLDFARWLVRDDHPLTPRVAVNRYWQLLFGRGFVETAEDFGSQGTPATHPQLLDWLAGRFVATGWNVKLLLKTIVMSQTYRQSSEVSEKQQLNDPENLLLSRAARLRLSGNVLRDQALFVSGLLVERQGGPSVYPYQPAGLWSEASNAKYKVGSGDDLYRRSLYTYWKRTLAPPSMALLDTGDRESCTVRPKRTNTPLQALALLNETGFVEAARKFAERLLTAENCLDDLDRLKLGFRSLLSRPPSDLEAGILMSALKTFREQYLQNPKEAAAIKKNGSSKSSSQISDLELATYTAMTSLLLNLEEVTTRE